MLYLYIQIQIMKINTDKRNTFTDDKKVRFIWQVSIDKL